MSNPRKYALLLLVMLVAIACNLPRLVPGEGEPAAADPDVGAQQSPLDNLFDQIQSLSNSGAEQARWDDFPGPSEIPAIEIPQPVGQLPQPDGQVNILLLGSDQRPDTGGFRTDTILLLTVNPEDSTASLTSFPRDLYVYIPGWTMQRINTAHARGSWVTTQQTFMYNFGVRPDGFVLMNFSSFEELIDSLGGITVDVAKTFGDHRDGFGAYSVQEGQVEMDGETALWYVRARYSTNDFDRTRRQQEVLLAVFQRLIGLDAIRRAPELLSMYQDNVSMNLNLKQITSMLPLALQINDSADVRRFALGPEQVTPWQTPGGAQVLLPRQDEVLAIMRQALSSP